jgi:APA family basic amino acid/polyamine antiporter
VNALTLAGARTYYAMAQDGLFFASAGRLNSARVPAVALLIQGCWAVLLVLPRTFNANTHTYGNLYSDLLEYIISAALLFYIATIAGVIRLRIKKPNEERPYRAFGYPFLPILYIAGAGMIVSALFVYRSATTWPGLVIVALGIPVYLILTKITRSATGVCV